MPHSEVMYNALSIYWFSLTVLLNIFTMVVVCTILLCCGKGVFSDVGYLIVRFWPLLVFFRSAWFYIFWSCNTTLGIKMFLHYQYYRHHHRQHHHQVAIIVYVCWFVAFFSDLVVEPYEGWYIALPIGFSFHTTRKHLVTSEDAQSTRFEW